MNAESTTSLPEFLALILGNVFGPFSVAIFAFTKLSRPWDKSLELHNPCEA